MTRPCNMYWQQTTVFLTSLLMSDNYIVNVQTKALLSIMKHEIKLSQCGNCNICKDVCPQKVLNGVGWDINVSRDEIVNVYDCVTCLKCLVYCLKTQAYVFHSKEDEILFFKTQKPEILGRLLFFYKIYKIETQYPNGSDEAIIALYPGI